jgi:hypothetical protein
MLHCNPSQKRASPNRKLTSPIFESCTCMSSITCKIHMRGCTPTKQYIYWFIELRNYGLFGKTLIAASMLNSGEALPNNFLMIDFSMSNDYMTMCEWLSEMK